ncbi:phenylacetic acid degradation protein [Thalassobaculum fulvum]|jgi:uncharacterized protein (TIGR00369 family)|uniref:Phenylacetic acid degradation protein n=1 Tax=Thalassobaculum fulvum TaxID=1633335 RepID=A0A919CQ35_9PROT|nr:PaaI family thioesterase [Thalassobaculum fulvum]GHD46477.1 phenylacetic acid degradation protein [Thalassobaculum fulvum]
MAARVSVDEMNRIMREEVPMAGNLGILFDTIEDGRATARLPFRDDLLRPGGTVTGPAMMAMADVVMYGAVLSRIGPVKLAVTTNLNANFLRRPKPGDLLADGRLIKCGRRLAYGEVTLVSADAPDDPVCHVTCTYSIPPEEAR